MKLKASAIFIIIGVNSIAQCSLFSVSGKTKDIFTPFYVNTYNLNSFENHETESFSEVFSSIERHDNSTSNSITYKHFFIPASPVLTTKSHQLEICEGNSTTLTAVCEYPIEWYSSYPPEGEPLGKGPEFVTPVLSKGYSVYYAISNLNGIKSVGSEMEVIMVYPTPEIELSGSFENLCAGEKVNLKAKGSRFYEWSTGETTSDISVNLSGSTDLKVTGINTAGCRNSKLIHLNVSDCLLELNSEVGKNKAELATAPDTPKTTTFDAVSYPNPNNGEFIVKVNNITADMRIELYDSFGENIYVSSITTEITEIRQFTLNNGIYTLRILDKSGLLKQEKVIVHL